MGDMMKRRLFCCLLSLIPFASALSACAPRAAVPARAFGGGWRPSPVDLSHLAAACRGRSAAGGRRLMAANDLPSRWDAREMGLVTPVKSQGQYGTCWAFATAAALETALKKGGETDGGSDFDLSENHLATHQVGFAFGYDDGGNNQLAAALLTAWRDPVREGDDPYGHPSSTTNPPPVRHVQNIVWLPAEEAGCSDEEKLEISRCYKQAVIDYGAVSVGYYHVASCYDGERGSFHVPGSGAVEYSDSEDGGHGVTLIGWDDDYPATNFVRRPPGDGAYLCKNSWGERSGTNGCIWISYYCEGMFSQEGAAYPAPEPVDNYGRVYQYDPCGQTQTWNVYEDEEDEARGGKENWCANVFTASQTGVVEAVGFYVVSPGTEYTLRVYVGCADTPVSGTLACEQGGCVDQAGYVTVRLERSAAIGRSGEKFAVVLHLEAPGTQYPIPVEATVAGWSTCRAGVGESFLSPDGENWTDFQRFPQSSGTENICIKAYTRYGSDGVELIAAATPGERNVLGRCGETVRFAVETTPPETGLAVDVTWEVDGVRCGEGESFEFATTAADHGMVEVLARATCGRYESVRTWALTLAGELVVDVAGAGDFTTIQEALEEAVEGDVITVLPGVYRGTVMPLLPVEIRSRDGAEVTIIDNGGGEYGTCCYDGEFAEEAVLRGFTLRGGSCVYGGGACCGTLSHCVITECNGNCGSAACWAMLDHCTVVGNTCWYDWRTTPGQVETYAAVECAVTDSLVWGNYLNQGGYWYADWDNVDYDPRFVSVENGDFRLFADSPALGGAADGTNVGAWQGAGVAFHTITVEVTGGGWVSPGTSRVPEGESLAFTVAADHPLLGVATNGVAVAAEGGVFVWENVTADGKLTADFVSMDFYVDAANGDDANTGWFPECAKRTLQAAADVVGPGETIRVASGTYGNIEVYVEQVAVVSEGGENPPFVADAVGADFIGFIVNTSWMAGLHSCAVLGVSEQCDLYNCTVKGKCYYCHQANCLAAQSAGADYRLSSDSEAIDAGDNQYVTTDVDLYGRPRISGARVDVGACERDLRNAGWLDPGVRAGDDAKVEAAKVMAAMNAQGFGASVCGALTALKDYSALGAWANARSVDRVALAGSATPLLAAALGSEGLREWRSEDVAFSGFGWAADRLRGTLDLDGYDRAKVHASLLRAAVGLVGAGELGGQYAPDGLEVSVSPGETSVEFEARPPADASACFLRAVLR